jgi:DNA polymerase-3 subunit epsilon
MGMPFGRSPFCLVDIETTGLSPGADEITEVAAIRVNERFEVVAEMSRLIRISRPVPWHITGLTGISDALLRREGGPLDRVLEDAWGFIDGMPSYAHNASFDRRFLDAFAAKTGKPFRFPLACSIPVFRRLMPGGKGYGLAAVAQRLAVNGQGAHRALADCRILLECLRRAHLGGVSR